MPKPSGSVTFNRVDITPPNAPFTFGFDCPTEWKQIELPAEQPDFSDPGAFMPLSVHMSPFAAILYSVAARPGYSDGSLYDWAKFLLEHHKFNFTQLMPGKAGAASAIRAMATQESEAGTMQVMVAFMEDAGSIIHVTGMAPAQLWGSMEETFEHMVNSFALHKPRGATVPLIPGMAVEKAPVATAPSATTAREKTQGASSENKAPAAPAEESALAKLAISDDSSTLTDPEQKLNAYFRDNGIGLLPRVISVHEVEKYAVMACGSIMAGVTVPFGWQVFDDGKRALVFTPDNKIQVNLSLINAGGEPVESGMDQIIAGMLKEQPQVQYQKSEGSGIPMLVFGGLNIEGEVLDQVFMFPKYPPREGHYVQLRITAAAGDMHRALDLAGAMVEKMVYPQ
jgi:hypothetical protein